MGKAALLIVLGAGLILMRQAFNNQITERESRGDQVEYEYEVLAREIARSGFNVAMGIAREYPNALDAGAYAVDMADGVADTLFTGTARGGEYAVRAEPLTGHSLEITATGYYGGEWTTLTDGTRKYTGASYTMSDSYKIHVLEVRSDGLLNTSFLESMAGYCSTVYMDEYNGDELVSTRMIFASGKNRDSARPPVSIYVNAGTQLNFFIGVDENCSNRFSTSASECEARRHIIGAEFDPSDVGPGHLYDHVHYALEIPAGNVSRMQEGPWAMVEQNPFDRQRWRIGWEDLDHPEWIDPNSTNREQSLFALKRFGYDGGGWRDRDAMGYRALRDYWLRSGYSNNGKSTSYRPDFSDQVIELGISAIRTQAQRDSVWYAMKSERDNCGITSNKGLPPEPTALICLDGEEREVPVSSYDAHIDNGATGGACPAPEPEVQVCYDDSERMVPQSQLSTYLGLGATEGACPEEQVVMCYDGRDTNIPLSEVATYLSYGATEGACPEEEVLVCHGGSEQMIFQSQLHSYLNDGATEGACPEEEEVYDCPCSAKKLRKGKVGVLHRPPGNPANERLICINRSGWINGHQPRHDDVLVCEG